MRRRAKALRIPARRWLQCNKKNSMGKLNIILIICLWTISGSLHSQSMLGKSAKWIYQYSDYQNYGILVLKDISKDTLIEGNIYSEIYRAKYVFNFYQNSVDTIVENSLFLREESKRLYQYDGEEILMYDFNLKVGDKLTYIDLKYLNGDYVTLESTGSHIKNGAEIFFQNFKVVMPADGYEFTVGLNSEIGSFWFPVLISEMSDNRTDVPQYFLCEYYNSIGDSIVQNAHFCDDAYDLLSNQNQIELTNIKIYPNPTSGTVFIENTNNSKIEFQLINSIGDQIHTGHVEGKVFKLDLERSSPGLYFIKLIDIEKGGYQIRKIYLAL